MIEIALLLCFIAVLSALVSVLRVAASISIFVARALWKRVWRPVLAVARPDGESRD